MWLMRPERVTERTVAVLQLLPHPHPHPGAGPLAGEAGLGRDAELLMMLDWELGLRQQKQQRLAAPGSEALMLSGWG